MLDLNQFADRLEELMFDAKLNPPALARILGIDRTTITRYLTGRKIPSLVNVIRLSDYFQCTSDFLLGLDFESRSTTFKKCPPFHDRLSFLLEHFCITKYQLQKWTQIPESAIYNWQRGDYTPTIDNVIKISKALECSVDFVLGRGD